MDVVRHQYERVESNVVAMIRELYPAILNHRSEAIRRHLVIDDLTEQQKAILGTRCDEICGLGSNSRSPTVEWTCASVRPAP